jgi:4-hydroxy-tetrahydrodipicolinate synthase
VAPRLMQEMALAALAGDRVQALELNGRLDALHHNLFVQSNPIPVKWAVAQMGLCPRGIRLPLTWLTEDAEPAVRAAMQQAGIA